MSLSRQCRGVRACVHVCVRTCVRSCECACVRVVSLSVSCVRRACVCAGVHAVYEAVCEIVTERPDEKRKIKIKRKKSLELDGAIRFNQPNTGRCFGQRQQWRNARETGWNALRA